MTSSTSAPTRHVLQDALHGGPVFADIASTKQATVNIEKIGHPPAMYCRMRSMEAPLLTPTGRTSTLLLPCGTEVGACMALAWHAACQALRTF